MKRFFILVWIGSVFCSLQAQPYQRSSVEIYEGIQKLVILGAVLYVAAHPDDENTRVITFLSKESKLSTAYLSVTRGDGGQNLIGPEIGNLLGLIRTQELLAARRIDGGEQFFTRAIDFGYSKTADETLKMWGKDEVLADMIWVIRKFQPDVIITRFPPDERAGHGHHQASAILAEEAFELSARTDVFPEQLKFVQPWQVRRLFTNTGRWWNTDIDENTPGVVNMDVGTYSPLLGESYTEIASRSRSKHSSQGFGAALRRGYAPEFFEFVKGDKADKEILEGVNTSWTRVKGGEKIQPLVEKALNNYNFKAPSQSLNSLYEIREAISKLESSVWKERKLNEVNELIAECIGIFAEASASHYFTAHGDELQIDFEFTNRSSVPVKLISIKGYGKDSTMQTELKSNTPLNFRTKVRIKEDAGLSGPYWLEEKHAVGLFKVDDQNLIGKAEQGPIISYTAWFEIDGKSFEMDLPLIYKWTDPAKGELNRPFEILPPAVLNLSEPAYIFTGDHPKTVEVLVRSNRKAPIELKVKLDLPPDWRSEPEQEILNFSKLEEEQRISFKVYPAKTQLLSNIRVKGYLNNGSGILCDRSLITISYDHIPVQTLLPPAEAKLAKIDLKRGVENVGYISGAGDGIPGALRNMGYTVREFLNEEVNPVSLKEMDAVVLGIRALNANPRIRYIMPDLLEFVKQGGNLIIQYNTTTPLETGIFTPYPLKISRDRVSEEDAEMRMLQPTHSAFNYPNKITAADFEGWVQERGLYFLGEWSKEFEALISANDTGESAKDGGLLVAKYGSGHFIYTGLSFFRQLPEGVPGAYRLFSNLVSLKQEAVKAEQSQSKKGKKK